MGLLCGSGDNGLHLMGLFTIGKIALKRESRRDSYSKRPDCEAILSLGLWHPPTFSWPSAKLSTTREWPLSSVIVSE